MANTAVRQSPAAEAWSAIYELVLHEKRRLNAITQEHGLAPQQAMALRLLAEPRTMTALADSLACDTSNVTGIVDRLEQRGLVERRAAQHDRRVKLLVLTGEGERLREELLSRMSEPPAALAAMEASDQRALRDLLRKVPQIP